MKDANRKPAVKPAPITKLPSFVKTQEAFYGINYFVFSSFGEFMLFITGIGKARMQRLQKIELTWIGSLMYKTNG